MTRAKVATSKGRCRICHHRADAHRPACAVDLGGGTLCGCVGITHAFPGLGDAKKRKGGRR